MGATDQEDADWAEALAHFGDRDFTEAPEKEVDGEFVLPNVNRTGVAVTRVRFNRAVVHANGSHLFLHCTFRGGSVDGNPSTFTSKMKGCTLTNVEFRYGIAGEFEDCTFHRCKFEHGVNFSPRLIQVRGLETCVGLEFVNVTHDGPQLARDLDEAPLPWWCRGPLTWANLRGVGSLPFFGLSYAGVPLLLLLIGAIDLYNRQVVVAAGWGARYGPDALGIAGLVQHLNRITVPIETAMLLGSGIALMIASTIYAVCCPARIKEVSLHRWVEEFGTHPVNYVPLSWQGTGWRCTALIFYCLGGMLALAVLVTRLVAASGQLARNLG